MSPMFYLMLLLKFAPWLIAGLGAFLFARSGLGRALTQRIRDGAVTRDDVAALAADLDEVRRELGEVQERLDFTERLVARQRGALPPSTRSEHDSPTPPELAPVG